jgi:hypothetical protein
LPEEVNYMKDPRFLPGIGCCSKAQPSFLKRAAGPETDRQSNQIMKGEKNVIKSRTIFSLLL